MVHYIVHLESGTYFPAEDARMLVLPEDRPDILDAFDEGTDAFRAQMADWFGRPINLNPRYGYVTAASYPNKDPRTVYLPGVHRRAIDDGLIPEEFPQDVIQEGVAMPEGDK